MTNSRDKGSRGEREAASVLRRELGVQVERPVQRSGKGLYGPADLLVFDEAGDLSRLAVEVKRVESISVAKLVEFVRLARARSTFGRLAALASFRMGDFKPVIGIEAGLN